MEELKDIFKEHGDSSSLAMRDVAANTELKQVTPCTVTVYLVVHSSVDESVSRYLLLSLKWQKA